MGMTGSMKNLGGGGQHQDDETGDETSAFLGTPNSVGGNRYPERGILKKCFEEDGGSSDNNEGLCEVERTLKSLNGYHEDILAALRVAATQRGLGDSISTPPPQGTHHSNYFMIEKVKRLDPKFCLQFLIKVEQGFHPMDTLNFPTMDLNFPYLEIPQIAFLKDNQRTMKVMTVVPLGLLHSYLLLSQ
jgi:hypothetical protein